MYRPISDYAIIGDCQSAALVSSAGSIDWLCLPDFDSPALFLRLLDDAKGGCCAIQVNRQTGTSRQYSPGTNILETTFVSATGKLQVTDLMPVLPGDGRDLGAGQDTRSEHRVVRLLRCTAGEVEFTVEVRPTFNYAQEEAQISAASAFLATARGPRDALHICLAGQQLEIRQQSVTAAVKLREGEAAALVLTWSPPEQACPPVLLDGAERLLATTRNYWEKWSESCDYSGDYRGVMLRSALTLKLMTFEATGAIIAAPTTSLPESVGGERNWDYRFTWLRDSTFVLIALMNLGYFGEARDFLHFLKRTLQTNEQFQVLYNIHGGREAEEKSLSNLDGYRGSRPVRIGNAAAGQKQLDIFGELIHCIYLYIAHPETRVLQSSFLHEFWPVVRAAANYVCDHWREPDNGIWEMRGSPRQFVYSKGSCWLALDRAIRLVQHFGLRHDVRGWQRDRDALHDSFVHHGFNPHVGAFVESYGSSRLDAAILRLPIMGVIDANDPRMLATITQIERRLMRNGLVYRYRMEDGMRGEEGAFAACGFWLVDNYVLSGRIREARKLFEHQLSFANDLGLLAEQIAPDSGAQLGNFPQAFTHIALVNAGIRLSDARRQRKSASHAVAEEQIALPKRVA